MVPPGWGQPAIDSNVECSTGPPSRASSSTISVGVEQLHLLERYSPPAMQSARETVEPAGAYLAQDVPAESSVSSSNYTSSYPANLSTTRTQTDDPVEPSYPPLSNTPGNLESIESEESDDQESTEMDPPRQHSFFSQSRVQLELAQRELLLQQEQRQQEQRQQEQRQQEQRQQEQRQQEQRQQEQRQQEQRQQEYRQQEYRQQEYRQQEYRQQEYRQQEYRQQQQHPELIQHQPNAGVPRQIPRSIECPVIAAMPMNGGNLLPPAIPGNEHEVLQMFSLADDLEESMYRLVDNSRFAARRLRESTSDSEWPRQARQSSSSSGLGLRRNSIGGLSTQSQPLVGGGANYSSLGLQSPAPSYRSQGNYAPGVASAVVADMREVLRVREEAMVERLKVIVTQALLPIKQQWSIAQAEMAEMKRKLETMQSSINSLNSRFQAQEQEIQNLRTGLQSQLMAMPSRLFESPTFNTPTNPPLVNLYPSQPFSITAYMMPNAYQQQQQQQPVAEQPLQYQAAGQQLAQFLPAPQQLAQYQPIQQIQVYEQLPREVAQQQQVPPTQTLTRASVITDGISGAINALQLGNQPQANGANNDYPVANTIAPNRSPQLFDADRMEVEVRRQLQNLNNSRLDHVQQEFRQLTPRSRTATVTQVTLNDANQQQQQQQQQQHHLQQHLRQQQHQYRQQQQLGEGTVPNNIGGTGPVTDL